MWIKILMGSVLSPVKLLRGIFLKDLCSGCGFAPGDALTGLCGTCRAAVEEVRAPFCPGCGGTVDTVLDRCRECIKVERPWIRAVSLVRMEGTGRELIHKFKYRNETSLARFWGFSAAQKLEEQGIVADFIVPVPLHWARRFSRGYNQTELFARILSNLSGIPLNCILRRKRATGKQAGLGRKERLVNLKGAFSLAGGANCAGSTILLVDDVFTTGSTMSAAAECLLEAGAKEIKILTLARG